MTKPNPPNSSLFNRSAIYRFPGKIFLLALAVIYLAGSYASLKTNIAWDSEHEQITLLANLAAVNGLLEGDTFAYKELEHYEGKYYGVGFQILAYPLQKLLYKPIARFLDIDNEAAFVLSAHWIAFNLFFASGVLVLLIFRYLTNDEKISKLVGLGYMLWPLLFGHGVFNVKDIPLLFAWLLCSWLILPVTDAYCNGQPIRRTQIFMLGALSGWLISIRLSGILIFMQYLITLACSWHHARRHSGILESLGKLHLPTFLIATTVFFMAFSPVFWSDPSRLVDAIRYMGHHSMAGVVMFCHYYGIWFFAGQTPMQYIPVWLSAKLPVAIIAGCLCLPFALWKNAASNAGCNIAVQSFVLSLFCTALLIPTLLALRNTVIYNDIRHILFLMPLYFMLGAYSLWALSRRIAFVLLWAMIIVFTVDNFMSFPYQYIWFNEAARLRQVDKEFDTDYWSSAARKAFRNTVGLARKLGPVDCIYTDGEGMNDRPLPPICLRRIDEITPTTPRPFLAVLPSIYVYMFALYPQLGPKLDDCSTVGEEKIHLLMGNGDIHLKSILLCK